MSEKRENVSGEEGAAPTSPDKASDDWRIAPGAPAAAPSGKKPLSRGQRIGLAVVAVVAVAIIAISALFLFSPGEGSSDSSDLLRTTASSSASASSAASAASSAAEDAEDAAAPESAESKQLVQSGTETVVSPGTGGQSSAPEPAPAPERDVVTVTISVTSATVGNPVSAGPVRFTFERGATVLDALVATGLSVNATSSAFGGSYVTAIGGLAEDPSKGAWGWKYSVNGVDPQMSAGIYELGDGDVVEWRYVTDVNG